jgi:hypothetical protein
MRLADYIKMRMSKITPSTNNTAQDAKRNFAIGELPPTPQPAQQKTLNKNITDTMEENNYQTPYVGGETVATNNPLSEDTTLRDHINRYKQHAMKQEDDKFSRRSYV